MRKKSKDRHTAMPPVTKIELSESNLRLRWVALILLVLLAAGSIAMGVYYALNKEPGWQEVKSAATGLHCGEDFVFQYECGTAGLSATTEFKSVTALYSRLTQEAAVLFSSENETIPGNLHTLNSRPNEAVEVDPALYQALTLLDRYDSRDLFLAPVAREYSGVFLAQNDGEAALYDPNQDAERMGYVREKLAYAKDPESISLTLLGENRVRLNVSDAYLAFARENGIETFADFGWMKNAFIADYLADNLATAGFTNGYLVSFDGFTRNLDARGETYGLNLFDRWENNISMPLQLSYQGPKSLVSLRNYPLSQADRWSYYAYGDGTVTSIYLSPETGTNTSSTDNLVSYSGELSCAEILMEIAPLYLTEEFSREQVLALEKQGISSIWAEDNVLYYTEKNADLKLLPESGGADYRMEYAQ